MQEYRLQYSFSIIGEGSAARLEELNRRLRALEGKPLSQVYQSFDRVPSMVRPEDCIEKVNIVRTTGGRDKFTFFVMVTRTYGMKHNGLWLDLVRCDYPEVTLAVVGSGDEGYRTCETLYQPQAEGEENLSTPDVLALLEEDLSRVSS